MSGTNDNVPASCLRDDTPRAGLGHTERDDGTDRLAQQPPPPQPPKPPTEDPWLEDVAVNNEAELDPLGNDSAGDNAQTGTERMGVPTLGPGGYSRAGWVMWGGSWGAYEGSVSEA